MNLIHKMMTLERTIAAEKGDLVLFVLVKRAEGIGLWDVLLSAEWFSTDDKETLEYITKKFTETLTPDEMVLISQIRPFPPSDPRVQEIVRLVQQRATHLVNHGHIELSSWTLSNMPISHAHIITATSPNPSHTATVTLSQTLPEAGETGAKRAFE